MERFVSLRRQQFRQYFQPSRLLLWVVPAPTASGLNVITLCFTMHCSYRPPMLAIAIHNINASYELIQKTDEYVLAVPGVSLVREALYCGTVSMREADKVRELNLQLLDSREVKTPGLRKALANIEMVKEDSIRVGDHLLVVGRALDFRVNEKRPELLLLSVGPDLTGYEVLARKGIHRIGTVKSDR